MSRHHQTVQLLLNEITLATHEDGTPLLHIGLDERARLQQILENALAKAPVNAGTCDICDATVPLTCTEAWDDGATFTLCSKCVQVTPHELLYEAS